MTKHGIHLSPNERPVCHVAGGGRLLGNWVGGWWVGGWVGGLSVWFVCVWFETWLVVGVGEVVGGGVCGCACGCLSISNCAHG